MDLCAHNFERRAITEWLSKTSCCPISRKPLTLPDLVPNHTLSERIERWKWQREHCDIDWEDSSSEDSVTTPTDSTSADIELGVQPKRFHHYKKKKRRHKHYETIPVKFMLLPQERHVLEIVRTKEAEDRALQRQKRCKTFTISVIVSVAALTAMGAALAKYVLNQDE